MFGEMVSLASTSKNASAKLDWEVALHSIPTQHHGLPQSSVNSSIECSPTSDHTILPSPPHQHHGCNDQSDNNNNLGAPFGIQALPTESSSKPQPPLGSSFPPAFPLLQSSAHPERKKRVPEMQTPRRAKFQPYSRRVAPSPLELRFAMRSLGRSSHTDLGLDDVVEGRRKLRRGLSSMSDEVVTKAFAAKMASKRCILSRISVTLAEVDAMEKQRDFLQALEAEANDATKEELQSVKDVLGDHGVTLEDDIAFGHAVYADELVALTIADMQINQIFKYQQGNDGDNTPSSSSDVDIDDDLIYEDD
ncbi:hypothetical protein BU15DRAFT_77000 [Melanogaster broomeanus]|nr:hypothetical protein BU15DRAFT_77000 [Melanogaster broomeanus]